MELLLHHVRGGQYGQFDVLAQTDDSPRLDGAVIDGERHVVHDEEGAVGTLHVFHAERVVSDPSYLRVNTADVGMFDDDIDNPTSTNQDTLIVVVQGDTLRLAVPVADQKIHGMAPLGRHFNCRGGQAHSQGVKFFLARPAPLPCRAVF